MAKVSRTDAFCNRIEALLAHTPERISRPNNIERIHSRWEKRPILDTSFVELVWSVKRESETFIDTSHKVMHQIIDEAGFELSNQYDLERQQVLFVKRPIGTAHLSQTPEGSMRLLRDLDPASDYRELAQLIDRYALAPPSSVEYSYY